MHGGSSPECTDVFLCYQRLGVSCALCNNFQAARPRQTTGVEARASMSLFGDCIHVVGGASTPETFDACAIAWWRGLTDR